MKFFKSTLAIILGLSVLCCGGMVGAPSKTTAETVSLFNGSESEQTLGSSQSINSNAVYQSSQEEIDPSAIDNNVEITYKNYYLNAGDCIDTVLVNSVLFELPKPQAEEYVFDGWYLDANFTEKFDVDYSTGYTLTENKTLYAKWLEVENTPVVVTLYRNYASNDVTIVSTIDKTSGDRLYSLLTPLRNGYTFAGWYTDRNTTERFVIPQGGVVLSSDLNLYAKWSREPETQVTISLYQNLTASDTVIFDVITQNNGERIYDLPTPNNSGYTFEGWFLDKDCTRAFVIPKSGYQVTESFSLFAKWSEDLDMLIVGLYQNDRSNDSCLYGIPYHEGATLYEKDLPFPTRDGYSFLGWYQDRAGFIVIPKEGIVLQNDIELYAKWEKDSSVIEYEVTLYKNDNVDLIFDSFKVRKGEKLYSLPTPTSDEHKFLGWFKDAAGNNEFVIPSSGVILVSNLNLFAKWEDVSNEVTISLFTNYSETNSYCIFEQVLYKGEVIKSIPSIKVTRDGYRFVGWYLDKAGTQELEIPASGLNVYVNINLYAKWEKLEETIYTIRLYRNYDFTDTVTFKTLKVGEGETVYSFPTPRRVGYVFLGWFEDKATTKEFVIPDTGVTFASNARYYAKWEEIAKEYTVKLYRNYSSSDPYINDIFEVKSGDKIYSLPTPSRLDYNFGGWYLNSACTNEFVIPSGGFVVTENLNLYAKWIEVEKNIVITIYRNYTPYDAVKLATITQEIGDVFYGIDSPSRAGFTFEGWFTDRECTNEFVIPYSGVVLKEDLNLFAKWVEVAQEIEIVFYRNYNEFDYVVYDLEKFKKNDILYSLPTISREGYTFDGWYLDRNATERFVITPGGVVLTENLSLFAKWVENVEEKVTLTLYNNIALVETPFEVITEVKNTVIYSLPTPTRTGFNFVGWYTNRACSGEAIVISESGMTLTENLNLYAKWEKAEEQIIVIKLFRNFSLNDDEIISSISCKFGEVVYDLDEPSRLGYTFGGWFIERECVNQFVIPESGVVVPEDLDLYAKWVANTYSIVFNADGGVGVMADQVFAFDEAQNVKPNQFTRNGYHFEYWRYNLNGEWYVCNNNAEIINLTPINNATIVFYAKWTEDEAQEISVILYRNYNKADYTVFDTIKMNANDKIYSLPSLTRQGYTFAGWFTDKNTTQEFVIAETGTVVSTNMALYAKWIEIEQQVSIIFYRNFYSTDYSQYDPMSFEKDTVIYEYDLFVPTRASYTFDGWFVDRACTIPYLIPDDGNVLSEDLFLFAKWSEVAEEKVLITLYRNYDSTDMVQDSFMILNKNERIYSLSAPLTRSGYTFEGWFMDRAGTISFEIPVSGRVISADVNLYAKWKKNAEKVTISLYKNFNETETTQYAPVSLDKNERIYSLYSPSRSGYIFGGWYMDRACTNKFEIPASGRVVSADLSLYAKWTIDPTGKVTLTRVIPQKDGSVRSTYSTMKKGSTVTKLGICKDTTRAFVGWYEDAAYTKPFDVGSGYVMNEDKTIYAKWVNFPVGDINNDGKIGSQDSFMLQWYLAANKNFDVESKAIADANGDGVVDRFDIHTINAFIMLRDKLKSNLYLPALSLTKKNLNLVSNDVVDQADLDKYLSERVEQTYGTPEYDSSKYNKDFDFNDDASVNDIDYQIFKVVVDNDLRLFEYLKK